MTREHYLGDGAYVRCEFGGLRISTMREREHYVILGPDEYEELRRFARENGFEPRQDPKPA